MQRFIERRFGGRNGGGGERFGSLGDARFWRRVRGRRLDLDFTVGGGRYS